MTYVLAFLISLVAGWSLAAGDTLFRAEERTGFFGGTLGSIFLLVVSAVGGLVLAGAIIWIFRSIISATVVVIILGGGWLGWAASNRLQINTAGATNRLIVGLAGLLLLYAVAWWYFPPPL